MKKEEKTGLPLLLSAKDMQKMGISRAMSYQILNRTDLPIIKIGDRKMIKRDEFLAWLDRCTVGAAEQ
ncbi:MAG: helix-turn-helix domain-containing protein [Bacteroides sp.]|nr:helix-turn-helix domain-containing protein [Eubacterium sp.]MCM1419141.1 helix-turn-helix domain-containing protein [Roseburia sp.]MCM1463228.1 helix-turn-helix domain-containing protein [Bacteroides sp.]